MWFALCFKRRMLSDLLRSGLWMLFLSDGESPNEEGCLTADVLWSCECDSGSCGLTVQSSGTNKRTVIRMNERKDACMINRSAGLFFFFFERFSLLGSTKVQTGALQLLEEEKVQQLYLNWGVSKLANSCTHLNNWMVTDAGGIPGTLTD